MQKALEKSNLIDKKQITEKYFLDTNILIYLINPDEPPKHNKSKEFIKNKTIFISIQNLKEFSNIMFTKTNLSKEDIKRKINIFGRKFFLLPELPEDIIKAIEINSNKKTFYDAILVATMKRNEINTIITENEKDFADFQGIKVINPFK